jgi:hypothetical protein
MPKKLNVAASKPVRLTPSEHEALQDEFVRTLMTGDAATGAKVLRKLDELNKPVLGYLADLLDGDPALTNLFPYRLKLVPRRRGRPPADYLTKQVKEQAIARAVALALRKFKKLDAAVNHVQHQYASRTGQAISRSAVYKCYAIHKDKLSS